MTSNWRKDKPVDFGSGGGGGGRNKGQGFLSKCYTGRKCCPTPWLTECEDKDVCYTDFFSCDGGRCEVKCSHIVLAILKVILV